MCKTMRPEEESEAETATLPQDSDNVERTPAITDADKFLPLPSHICTISSNDEPLQTPKVDFPDCNLV